MKNTKENLLKLLEEERRLNHRIAEHFEEKGDKATAANYIREASTLSQVIYLLTDQEFFDKIWKNIMEN